MRLEVIGESWEIGVNLETFVESADYEVFILETDCRKIFL